MKEFKLGKNALILSVLTLLTVITWIGFEIYFTLKKTTIPQTTREQISPLEIKIEPKIIEKIKENIFFSEEQSNSNNYTEDLLNDKM